MLEGLEISILPLSYLDLNDRVDAEYFQKYNLIVKKKLLLKPHKKLSEVATFVASAFYPAATHLYDIGNTPFIRCVDCINFPLITKEQDSLFEKIPMDFVNDNNGVTTLQKGDIVITKVGSPCYSSIIYEHDIVALSRTVMGLKHISNNINPLYLLAFLRSKYGFQELYRSREQTIQFQLTLERVRNIIIYEASQDLQNAIAEVYNCYFGYIKRVNKIYEDAELILLNNLYLDLSDIKINSNIAEKSFSAFMDSGRLDAEYYQPKYDKLFAKLEGFETKRLGDIVHIDKSIEPGSEAYQNSGIPFIRVANLSKYGITDTDIFISPDDYADVIRPKRDSILLSKDGSVGIAYKVEQDMNVITSGAILHLTVTDKEFMPDYLTLVLNSVVVGMQAERDAGGSVIQHWKPSEIKNVIIPKLSIEIQQEITDKVRESFALRKESMRLLELAKTAVEVAIEQGETAAMEFITANK